MKLATIKAYVHGSRESMWDEGEKLGLQGEALRLFSFALYEIQLELDVNDDGSTEIVAVNGRRFEK